MPDVMSLREAPATAREPAAAVPVLQRASDRRRNGTCPGANLHDAAVRRMPHHHPARVARQPLRGLRGHPHAVLEHRLPGRLGVREHRRVHVDHDLIALAGRTGVHPPMQCRLRQQRQRISLLLLHRRLRRDRPQASEERIGTARFRGNSVRPLGGPAVRRRVGKRVRCPQRARCTPKLRPESSRFRGNASGRPFRLAVRVPRRLPRPLVERLPRRRQRLHEDRPFLGSQPPPDDHHAVIVLIHVQGPACVPLRRLQQLRPPVHCAPAADDPLHVRRRAGPPHDEQPLLRLRRRHARERAHLGVRELSARQRLRQPRQRPQRPRHADALPRGPEIQPHAPRQPLGARAEAIAPAAALIELANQIEQAGGGGIEMRGQLGDAIAETFELGDVLRRGDDARRAEIHRVLLCWSDSTLAFPVAVMPT